MMINNSPCALREKYPSHQQKNRWVIFLLPIAIRRPLLPFRGLQLHNSSEQFPDNHENSIGNYAVVLRFWTPLGFAIQ
jgi:hypothetical protein